MSNEASHSISWPERVRIARQMARRAEAHTREEMVQAAFDAKIAVPKHATKEQVVRQILYNEAATPPARTTATETRTLRPALGATNEEE